MAQTDRRSGLSRLARAGLTLVMVIAGVAILALTAGPVAAPAEPLSMSGASATPGGTEAMLRPDRSGSTLEAAGEVALGVAGEAGVEITKSAAPTRAAGSTATLPAASVGVSVATVRVQWTTPGSPVTPSVAPPVFLTPGSPSPVQPTLTSASPAVAQPTVAPPTVASATVTSPTAPPATATPPTVAPPGTYEDLADFEAFLVQQRSTIGGQPFEILSLTVDTSDAAAPYFVLSIDASESTDVFGALAAADTLAYGRVLLGDVVRYIGGGSCTVVVNAIYQTASPDACAAATPWCQVGPRDESSGTWPVDWIYVRARQESGVATIEAWNSIP